MSLAEILQELPRLTREDRALLADRLAETGDPLAGGTVAEAWKTEARRRLAELDSGRVLAIPGDAALAQVRRQLGE